MAGEAVCLIQRGTRAPGETGSWSVQDTCRPRAWRRVWLEASRISFNTEVACTGASGKMEVFPTIPIIYKVGFHTQRAQRSILEKDIPLLILTENV